MVVAHFFVRRRRGRTYLFVETTCSMGEENPEPRAREMFGIGPMEGMSNVMTFARKVFMQDHPDLLEGQCLNNSDRIMSDHPSFDMVFFREGER